MKKTTPLALFAISSAFLLPFFAFAQSFLDVKADHPNADAILYVEQTGMVNGYPDGTFKPDNTINRAEFTKIFVNSRLLQSEIEDCDTTVLPFPDVPAESWFAPYVCAAYNAGIIQGYPDGTFKPAETINFVETAKILTANRVEEPSTEPWYRDYVLALEVQGAIPTDISAFDAKVTRGQVAEMIMRINAGVDNKKSLSFASLEAQNTSEGEDTDQNTENLDISSLAEGHIALIEAEKEQSAFEMEEFEDDMNAFELEIIATEAEMQKAETKAEEIEQKTEETVENTEETEEIAENPAIMVNYTQEAFASAQGTGEPFVLLFYTGANSDFVALEAEIEANMAELPPEIIILKVNYDEEADLKAEYGVEATRTAVFFDNEGSMTEKVADIAFEGLKTMLETLKTN